MENRRDFIKQVIISRIDSQLYKIATLSLIDILFPSTTLCRGSQLLKECRLSRLMRSLIAHGFFTKWPPCPNADVHYKSAVRFLRPLWKFFITNERAFRSCKKSYMKSHLGKDWKESSGLWRKKHIIVIS